MRKPLTIHQIADAARFARCISCGVELAVSIWSEVDWGVLDGACDCGQRQRMLVFDGGEPLFDVAEVCREPQGGTSDEGGEDEEPPPFEPDEGEPLTDEEERRANIAEAKAARARANLRLLDATDEEPLRQKTKPVQRPDKLEVAKAKKAKAVTPSEHASADTKIKDVKRDTAKKKQGGFAGLWGKNR